MLRALYPALCNGKRLLFQIIICDYNFIITCVQLLGHFSVKVCNDSYYKKYNV